MLHQKEVSFIYILFQGDRNSYDMKIFIYKIIKTQLEQNNVLEYMIIDYMKPRFNSSLHIYFRKCNKTLYNGIPSNPSVVALQNHLSMFQ